MSRKLLRVILGIVIIEAIALAVGAVISRKLTKGDEDSDEFQVAAVMGGKKFCCHAEHLRSGTVIASMGGVDIDLRDATLDPAGANLELKATMGGVQAVVPDTWAVEVNSVAVIGGVDTDVTAPEDLPDDAPRLFIDAVTRMGGVLVTTKAS
jgi:hypothetical protein